jgi:hypothetical protein
MNSHAEKKPKQEQSSVASEVSKKQDEIATTFQFEDNRPEAIVQRKMQKIINDHTVVQLERGRSRERDSPQDVAARRNRQRYSSVDRRFGFAAESGSADESEAEEHHFEEADGKEESSSRSRFTRTGHGLTAHATSAAASVARAKSKGNTYNGRWKNGSARDQLIDRFYDYLALHKLKKGAYFVRCHIPLSVGCADDQMGHEHPCDGFFIKMDKMGSKRSKWKYSTTFPALESEIKGNVTKVKL